MASFTANGNSTIQAYEALREMVRKVESGELRILDMSITQEAPETRDFNTINGVQRRMLVRNGDLSVEIKLAYGDGRGLQYDPVRDEYGRLRGDVGIPRDPRTGQFGTAGPRKPSQDELIAMLRDGALQPSQLTKEQLMQIAGMTRVQYASVEEELARESEPAATTQAPVNPMAYGARKVDID